MKQYIKIFELLNNKVELRDRIRDELILIYPEMNNEESLRELRLKYEEVIAETNKEQNLENDNYLEVDMTNISLGSNNGFQKNYSLALADGQDNKSFYFDNLNILDWLSLNVNKETIKELSKERFLALVFYEITFLVEGLSEEERELFNASLE